MNHVLLIFLSKLNVDDNYVNIVKSGQFEKESDGIVICFNDKQYENALDWIVFTEEGIVILLSDEQKENAFFPINLTDDGIIICKIDEQWENVS